MKRTLLIFGVLLVGMLLGAALTSFGRLSAPMAMRQEADLAYAGAPPPAPAAAAPAAADEEAPSGGVRSGERKRALSMKRMETIQILKGTSSANELMPAKPAQAPAEAEEGGVVGGVLGSAEPEAPPSRAWFPETFLFEPLVVTDGAGQATVPVKVPDRLTRWRVLALAHSRSGAQAGAVASFAGTLPTYVDPVVPAFLRAGDAVRLPVQVVNTTSAAVEQPLKLSAEGAVVEGGGARTVKVPAQGSVVEYVTVKATQPGPVSLRASLGSTDAVVRGFEVVPTGRPVSQTRGGSLAAPRTLTLEGPAEVEAGSERVRLLVYPGALGVLRSELSAAAGRWGVAEDAYTLLLAGRAPTLLKTLGETADGDVLKAMASVSGQRVLRAARTPDVPTAALLAQAALTHPDNPVLLEAGRAPGRAGGQRAAARWHLPGRRWLDAAAAARGHRGLCPGRASGSGPVDGWQAAGGGVLRACHGRFRAQPLAGAGRLHRGGHPGQRWGDGLAPGDAAREGARGAEDS